MTTKSAIEPDKIYVVETSNSDLNGKVFIPCLPYEEHTKTFQLKNGTIVKYLGPIELGPGNKFYKLDIFDTGDIVLMPVGFESSLKRLLTKNNNYSF